MKNNNYQLLNVILKESYEKLRDEKIIKTYSAINVKVYHKEKLLFKNVLLPRISLTNKRIIFDRLSTFLVKIQLPIFHAKLKNREEISIPYDQITSLEYDKNRSEILLKFSNNYLIVFSKKIGNSKDMYEYISSQIK